MSISNYVAAKYMMHNLYCIFRGSSRRASQCCTSCLVYQNMQIYKVNERQQVYQFPKGTISQILEDSVIILLKL